MPTITSEKLLELIYRKGSPAREYYHSKMRILIRAFEMLCEDQSSDKAKRIKSFDDVKENDPDTFELLRRSDANPIWFFSDGDMQDLLNRIQPDCYEDLIAAYALYLPQPLHLGMADKFIERKKECKDDYKNIPTVYEILHPTYGVAIYEQQIENIAQTAAGFDEQNSQEFALALNHKSERKVASFKTAFVNGTSNKGIPLMEAERLYEELERYIGGYSDRERAEIGAWTNYRFAYLQTHFPLFLRAAALTGKSGNLAEMEDELWVCREMGIHVLGPDINYSSDLTILEGKAIRLGLSCIVGIREQSTQHILSVRKKNKAGFAPLEDSVPGTFSSFEEFLINIDLDIVSQKEIELLIKARAFDSILKNPRATFECLESLISQVKKGIPIKKDDLGRLILPNTRNWNCSEYLQCEYEALGFYSSGHPLKEIIPPFFKSNLTNIKSAYRYDRTTVFVRIISVTTIGHSDASAEGIEWALVTLDDESAKRVAYVAQENYHKVKKLLRVNNLLLIEAECLDMDQFEPHIEIIDAFKITRKLPLIQPENFHFGYVKYMAEKTIAETILEKTIDLIRHDPEHPKQIQFDYTYISVLDDKTYDFIQTKPGKTFREWASYCEQVFPSLKPNNFDELITAFALSHYGHFHNGTTEGYIKCLRGEQQASYLVPELEQILKPTFGHIVYQEQIREIVETFAGYSFDESTLFCRTLAIKRSSDLAGECRRFVTAVAPNIMTEDEARAVFEWMEEMAGPAVKKAAQIDPVTMCYRLAWLKVHYPDELESAWQEIDRKSSYDA